MTSLMKIDEVAEALKVSERTVLRLVKAGELQSYRIGSRGRRRFKRSDVERVLQPQRREPDVCLATFIRNEIG
jgi:excisionase family DNA binding protein